MIPTPRSGRRAKYSEANGRSEKAGDSNIEVHLDEQAFDCALAKVLENLPREPIMLFALRYEEDCTLAELLKSFASLSKPSLAKPSVIALIDKN